MVIRVLGQNAANASRLVAEAVPALGADREACPCGCDRALDHALITAEKVRDAGMLAKLDAVARRVLS
jgi:5'-methylthioadenosine phosphorylase